MIEHGLSDRALKRLESILGSADNANNPTYQLALVACVVLHDMVVQERERRASKQKDLGHDKDKA